MFEDFSFEVRPYWKEPSSLKVFIRATLFGFLDAQPKTLAAGLDFWAIAESEYPAGAMAQLFAQLGELNGLAALRYTTSLLKHSAAILLRDAPAALREDESCQSAINSNPTGVE